MPTVEIVFGVAASTVDAMRTASALSARQTDVAIPAVSHRGW